MLTIVQLKHSMEKENKDFEAFPVRTLRASDKTWEDFKDKKIKSGLSWNRFINSLLEKKK